MKNFLFSVFILIFAVNANATVLLKFCDQYRVNLMKIKEDLNFLKSSNDSIRQDANCIEVKTSKSKESLFTKYIQQKYSGVRIESSEDLSEREQCQIILSKVILNDSEKTDIGNRMNKVYLNQKNVNKNTHFKGSYSVYSDSPSSLQFEDESFKVVCSIRNGGFNISFESLSEKLKLNSKVFIKEGQKMKIGSIHAEGHNHNAQVGILKNKLNKKKSYKTAEIFLEVAR